METIGTDETMTLDGNKSLPSSTQSKEIVDVTEIDIAGAPKESADIVSNAMMVEETENSTSATQLKVIMDPVEINNADTTKEPTDINRDQVLVEETANPTNLTQLKEMGSAEVPMENMVDIDVPMENVVDVMVDFIKLKGHMMSFPPKTILVRIEDLKGLENYFMIASQNNEFNLCNKWVDLRVTEWPIIEYFQKKKQFDGSSCGLFMLQFMEYFTGEDLAHDVTQEGIEAFREHIAIILYESVLNEIRGKPVYETVAPNSDASNSDASNSDCMIVDNSNGLELPGGVGEKCPIPVHNIPTDQDELYKGLYKQIMLIQDAKCLEKEWVRSSQPYLIGLSLRKIQNIIRMDQPMDTDCFNLAVRIVACDELLQMVETDVHYMDLRFSVS
ncbi:unnamed protein product [Alopecurus aequalis]